ncbi:MAG: GH3 auxin-responsive promoter family protein [Alphaproteobacteria bacterium]|nr:GH3 auxin-responsive promoter family protein [Alphaproteobacteria bacterium]
MMPLDLTPALRLYGRYRRWRLASLDPERAQERELLRLVRAARNTRFGRDHDFAGIKNVADFQARVPLRRYEDMWRDYWQPAFPTLDDVSWPGRIPYFAVSSGTTSGTSKYIPLSRQMRQSNVRAALDVLAFHAKAKPKSRFFAGPTFMLGGSTTLVKEADGVHSGDLSAIAAMTLPRWAAPYAFPPNELALLTDWNEKLSRTAEASLHQDIRALTGTPSWVLILLERVRALRDAGGAAEAPLYPHLSLYIHGGVNFAPYRQRFAKMFEGQDVDLREVYPASEGFIAAADRGPGEGLRLFLDTGLFFEFVPLAQLGAPNPTRHWVKTIQPDVNYAVVMTTCAGLFSYVIGDTVRFVDTRTPRLLITGRTSYMLSAFGEHLIGEEIEKAVTEAAGGIGAQVTDFSVGTIYPDAEGDLGQHLYIVEFETEPQREALLRFAAAIDDTLLHMNDDYRAHRAGGHGLKAPRVQAVGPGTFAAWMESRGRAGGQNKVPRIINDAGLFEGLKSFTGAG